VLLVVTGQEQQPVERRDERIGGSRLGLAVLRGQDPVDDADSFYIRREESK
jgi:hypothetical protein